MSFFTANSPSAVFWDLDGTIIDSEDYWITAEMEIANRFQASWSHADGLWQVGQGLPVTAQAMIDKGVKLSIQQIIDELGVRVLELLSTAIPWRPGAVELLQELCLNQVPVGLVTMSVEPIAQYIARNVPGVTFDVIVSGDTASEIKPHPAPYLQAANALEVDPTLCVAIEDSPSGITSARSAGMCVIGVQHLVAIDKAGSSVTWSSLSGRTASDVQSVFSKFAESDQA